MEPQKSRHLTIMIMPETIGGEVRRLRVPKSWLKAAAGAASVLVLLALGALAYGGVSYERISTNGQLEAENTRLRADLHAMDVRISEASQTVMKLKDYERRLRSLTMVHDPARHLAIGPVGSDAAGTEAVSTPNTRQLRRALLSEADVEKSVELLNTRLDSLHEDGDSVEGRVEHLSSFLEGQRTRLASTPSRRPSPGYVSSTFGMRVDPFTGLPQFHSGLDFAANIGARVIATADGTVVKAGPKGAYGNTVQIDHGYGLSTLFGHMSRINVEVGDQVRRGDLIGAVGNTGRSTGPHLHYEVRMNGIPQDPSRFVLE